MHPDALKPKKLSVRFLRQYVAEPDQMPMRWDWYCDWCWAFYGGGCE